MQKINRINIIFYLKYGKIGLSFLKIDFQYKVN